MGAAEAVCIFCRVCCGGRAKRRGGDVCVRRVELRGAVQKKWRAIFYFEQRDEAGRKEEGGKRTETELG